jgi:hypothetical protein
MPDKPRTPKRFVAVVVDGDYAVHATDVTGNYASLCGLDGDDGVQLTVELPKMPKVTCLRCLAIVAWSKTYKRSELGGRDAG